MNNARHILLADGNWLHVCATKDPDPATARCEGLTCNAPPSSWAAVTESPGPRLGIPWVRVRAGSLARLTDAAARHTGAEELREMIEKDAE